MQKPSVKKTSKKATKLTRPVKTGKPSLPLCKPTPRVRIDSSLLKIGQAAKTLDVSIDTLRRWEKAGKIEAIRTPGGTRLYSLESLKKVNPVATIDQTNSISTEELLKRVNGQTPSSPIAPVTTPVILPSVEDSSNKSGWTIVNRFLIGSAMFLILTLLLTFWITASYLTAPKETAQFFKHNIASGILRPFRFLAKELSFALREDPPPLDVRTIHESPLQNNNLSSVLAVTSTSPFLEVNADTQISGSLFVRDLINGLNLEATSSAGTMAFSSGGTTLTITNDALLDQDVSTTSSPSFASLTLSSSTSQLSSGGLNFTLPATATTLIGKDTTDTLTKKSISGSDNTFTNIPNSALSNSKVTVTVGTNLTGGGDVNLGSSISIALKDSPAVTSITASGIVSLADGTAAAPSLTFSNDLNTGLYRIGTDKIGLITGGSATKGLTIDSSGNVGIGTITPAYQLETTGNVGIGGTANLSSLVISAGSFLAPNGSATAPAYSFTNLTNAGVWTNGDGLLLTTGGSNASGITVTGAGSVGIGTSSPASALDVIGSIQTSTGLIKRADGQTVIDISGDPIIYNPNGTPVLTVGSGTASDGTSRWGGLAARHNVAGEEPYGLVFSDNGALTLGGGRQTMNAVTNINFNTAADNTTQTGTTRMSINGSGAVNIVNDLTVGNGFTLTTGALNLTSTSGKVNMALSPNTNAFTVNGLFGIDTTNGSVGIGTTAPDYTLRVNGTGYFTGFVGIGSSLNVSGNVGIGQSLTVSSASTLDSLSVTKSVSGATLGISGNSNLATVYTSGNIGIGATSTAYNLDVWGTGRITSNLTVGGTLTVNGNITGPDTGTVGYVSRTTNPVSLIYPTTITDTIGTYGNIGIGTTDPDYNLKVMGTGYFSNFVGIGSSLNVSGNVGIGASASVVSNLDAGSISTSTLSVSGAGYLETLTTTGNVGIGASVNVTSAGIFGSLGTSALSVSGNTTLNTLTTSGNAGIGGSASITGLTYALGGLRVNGYSDLTGNVGIGSSLNVTSAALLDSLSVTKSISGATLGISGNVGIGASADIVSNLNAGSISTSNLSVSGAGYLQTLTTSGNAGIGGTATITSLTQANGGLTVLGSSILQALSATDINSSTLTTTGNVGIGASVNVTSAGIFGSLGASSLSISGNTTLGTLTTSGNTGIGGSASITGLTYALGGVRVNGYSDLTGNVGIGSSLNVTSVGLFGGLGTSSLSVSGNTTLGTLYTTGNVGLGASANVVSILTAGSVDTSTLSVSGNTTLNTLTTSGNAGIGQSLTVSSAAILDSLSVTKSISGATLGISGNSNLATVYTSGNIGIGATSTAYNLDVWGTGRITSNLTVGGTLTVNGNITGPDTGTVGYVSRTTNPVSLIYPTTITDTIGTYGNIGIGTTDPDYNLKVMGTGYFSNFVGIGSSLNVAGNVGIGQSLTVTSATTLDSLSVTKSISAATLGTTGNVGIGASADIVSNLNAGSISTSTLSVSGAGYLETLTTTGNVGIGASVNVTSAGIFGSLGTSALSVSGNTTLNTLTTSGNAGIGGSASITGLTYALGGLRVNGYSDLTGNVGIGSSLNVTSVGLFGGLGTSSLSVSGNTTLGTLYTTGNVGLGSSANVVSILTAGSVDTSTLSVSGNTTLGTLTTVGNVGVGASINVTSAGIFGSLGTSALSVSGNTTLNTLTAAGNVGIGSSLNVTSAAILDSLSVTKSISGATLGISGNSYLANVFTSGNVGIGATTSSNKLDVWGNTRLNGTLTVNGNTLLSNTLTTLSSTNFVGIGTTSPLSQLHVVSGNVGISSSQGFGSEQVLNGTKWAGDFDEQADVDAWSGSNTTKTLSSGRIRSTNTADASGYIEKTVTTEVGKQYYYTITFSDGNVNTHIRLGTSSAGTQYAECDHCGTQTLTGTITATSTTLYVNLKTDNATATNWTEYDNISVREVGVAPSYALQIAGNMSRDLFKVGDYALTIPYTGNIGIGISAPDRLLQVASTIDITSSMASLMGPGGTQFNISGATTNAAKKLAIGIDTTNNYGVLQAGNVDGTAYNLALQPGGGNVGIGTTTPLSLLSVAGGAHIGSIRQGISAPTDGLFVDGNVGIGATTSSNKLDVWGNARIAGTGIFDSTLTALNGLFGYSGVTAPTSGLAISGNLGIGTTSPNNKLQVIGGGVFGADWGQYSAPSNGLLVQGNIGIGATTSSNKLDVWGNSRISGTLTVDSTGTLGSGLIGYSGVTAPTSGLAVSGNIGIGTTSTLAPLHVWGNNTNAALFLNGNVGIGFTTANSKLDVTGNVTITPTAAGADGLQLTNGTSKVLGLRYGASDVTMDIFSPEPTNEFSNGTFENDLTSWTYPETTLTLQPDGTDGEDAYFQNTIPNTNMGEVGSMGVGEHNGYGATSMRAAIKFDLSSLPATAIISSATLSMWIDSDASSNARTFRLYRLLRSWEEMQVTWNVYSTGNSWQTAGGFGANDSEQTDIGSRDFTATETLDEFKDFSLVATTKAELDLGNGWLMKADTEADDAYYLRSSDHATAATRPKLVVVYAMPVTRDTSITYGGSAASAKIVTSATTGQYVQSINVGDTGTYNLVAYAYTDGSAVTSADASLYYNGSTITTTYTPVGGGWYRLTGSLTGANEARNYGVQVEANKTVYIDNLSLQSGIGSTKTLYMANTGTGISHFSMEGQTTINTKVASEKGLIIQGVTSQVGNLTEWQNSLGSILSVIDSNGNLGIGTSQPQAKLSIQGNVGIGYTGVNQSIPVNGLAVFGNVGIGVTTANAKLAVAGGQVLGTGYAGMIAPTNGLLVEGLVGIGTTAPGNTLAVNGGLNLGTYASSTGPSNGLSVSGNIGIGTTTANNALSVAGAINIGNALGITAPTNGALISGNVGIGATTSSNKLDVWGNQRISGTLTVDSTGTLGSGLIGYSGVTAPTSGLAISGNVGIGTTSPVAPLHVWGNNTNSAFFLNGNVGIGTTSPRALFDITSGSANTAGDIINIAGVTGADQVLGNNGATLILLSNDDQAVDKGGSIAFGGRFTGIQGANWATIKGAKSNSTDNNYSGYLAFGTRTSGSSMTEKMRIDNAGNLGIGTTSPLSLLSVVGNAHIGSLRQGISAPTDGLFVDGNVGIGATTSSNKLDVWGNARIAGTLAIDSTSTFGGNLTLTGNLLPSIDDTFDLGSDSARWANVYVGPSTLHIGTSTSDEYTLAYDTTNNRLGFNVNGSGPDEITFDSNGNIGIGTTNPLTKIHTTGEIRAPKINKVVVVDGTTYAQTCAGINAAIDALGSAGGEIYLPEATYTCSETVTIDYNNTTIKGAGKGTIIDASAGQPATAVIDLNGKDYLTLRDFQVKGQAGGGVTSDLIYSFSPTTNTIFDGLYVLNSDRYGMYFNNGSDNVIQNSIFTGNDQDAIRDANAVEGFVITNNYITNNISIQGNNHRISDNYITGLISISTANYVRIVNNIGGGRLLMSSGGSYNVISGNYFVVPADHGGYGINIDISYGVISNNTIVGNTSYKQRGIFINGGDYNIVQGNNIRNVGNLYLEDNYAAIHIASGSTDNVVAYNSLEGNTTDYDDDGTDTQITTAEDGKLALGLDSTPDATLEIIKTGTTPLLMLSSAAANNGDYLVVNNDGNIGIGASQPQAKLSIQGNVGIGYTGVNQSIPVNGLAVFGNIGIGVTTANSKLAVAGGQVLGTGYAGMIAPTDGLLVQGLVGIGTTAPGNTLAVSGGLNLGTYASSTGPSNGLAVSGNVGIGTTSPRMPLEIWGSNGYAATFLNGNVGIGTTAPNATLQINTSAINTKGLVVKAQSALPDDISGLQVWFKADAITGISEGGAVGTWTDSSGNANNATQATADYKPTYRTNILNGKPVVRFDGSNDVLTPSAATLGNLFVVARLLTPSSSVNFQGIVGSTAAVAKHTLLVDGGGIYCCSAASLIGTYGGNIYVNGTDTNSISPETDFHIISYHIDSAQSRTLQLGYEIPSGTYGNVEIAEVILYSAALSSTDRQKVEAYLSNKYGIAVSGNPANLTEWQNNSGDNLITFDQFGGAAFTGNVGIGITSALTNLAVAGNMNIGWGAASTAINSSSTGLAINGNLGLGTTSPNSKLQVIGGGVFGADYGQYSAPANGVLVQGNVGIGSTGSVNYNLDVWGTGRITGALTTGGTITPGGQFLALDGAVGAPSYSFASDTDTGIYRPSANAMSLSTNGANVMTLTQAKLVGIGTTAPAALLQITDSASPEEYNVAGSLPSHTKLYITGGLTESDLSVDGIYGRIFIGADKNKNYGTYIGTRRDASANFYQVLGIKNNGTSVDAMTINANGNVGIGTTDPRAKLEIYNNAAASADGSEVLRLQANYLGDTAGSGGYLSFYSGNTESGRIRSFNESSNVIGLDFSTYNSGLNQSVMRITGVGNLGIGATTANSLLSVAGGAHIGSIRQGISAPTDGLFVDGNVGIGATTSSNKLDVWGNSRISGTLTVDSTGTLGSGLIGYSSVTAPTSGLAISGNVGIGFTSPAQKLHVRGTDGAGLIFADNSNTTGDAGIAFGENGNQRAYVYWDTSQSSLALQAQSGYGINLNTNGSDTAKVTIQSGGNVGIGTGSPVSKLHLIGSGTTTAPALMTQNSTSTNFGLAVLDNGNVGIGTTSPTALLELNTAIAGTPVSVLKLKNSNAAYQAAGIEFLSSLGGGTGMQNVGRIYGIATAEDWATARVTIQVPDGGGTLTDALTVQNGEVGIGTASPDTKLHVVGTNTGVGLVRINNSSASAGDINGIDFYHGGNSQAFIRSEIADGYATKLYLGTAAGQNNAATKVTIDSSGNLGIGATTVNSKLSVVGNAHIGSIRQGISAPTDGLFVDGNVGIGATTSSNKLDVWGNSRISGTLTVDSTGTLGSGLIGYSGVTAPTSGLAVSGNVGIGTTSTLAPLHIWGNNTNAALFLNGNVGIGFTTANSKLDVTGNVTITPTSAGADGLQLTNGTSKVLGLRYGTSDVTMDIFSTEPTNLLSNGTFDSDLTSWTYPSTTVTLQPDGASGKDADMMQSGGTYNYGAETSLRVFGDRSVDNTARAAVQFDLSSIPSTAIVSSASLQLYLSANTVVNAHTLYAFRLKRDWVEGTGTQSSPTTQDFSWQRYAGTTTWQSWGGTGANDRESTSIGSYDFAAGEATGAFKSFTLTAGAGGVQDWVDGSFANNGVFISAATDTENESAKYYTFSSSDNATSANRPKMVITYTNPPTVTRDTSKTYGGSTASAKIVTGGTAGQYIQSINVGDTSSYNLVAYAYTDGTAVTSANASLYYNGSTITTTYTAVGSGWYRLTGSLTGANEARNYGVQVAANKTVYIDSISLQSGIGNTKTLYMANTGTGISRFSMEGQTTINTKVASEKGLVIQGVSSQTADLLQIQNSSGGILSVVNADGNLGIGTSFPYAKLSIQGNVGIGYTGANQSIPVNGLAVFGNVGIGVTTANAKLAVAGGQVLGTGYAGMIAPANGLLVQGLVGIGTTAPGNTLAVNGGLNLGTYASSTGPSNGLAISGNIGIGTTTANNALSVAGAINIGNALGITAPTNGALISGNVGIGATTSSNKLDVWGNARVTGTFTADSTTMLANALTVTSAGSVGIGITAPVQTFQVNPSGTSAFVINSSGNVGIGFTSPSQKFQVGSGSQVLSFDSNLGSLGLGTVTPGVIVSDSFNRADSATTLGNADTGQSWVTYDDTTWGISSNQAYKVSGGNNDPIAAIDSGISDGVIQVTVSTLPGNGHGLIFRANPLTTNQSNAQSYWYLRVDDNRWVLSKVVSTYSFTDYGTYNGTASGDVLKVVMQGSVIKAYVNGSLFATANDAFNQGATKHGFRAIYNSSAGRYDNFTVSKLNNLYVSGSGDINIDTAASVGLTIKGASSQVANLTEWKNSSRSILSVIDAYGNLGIGTSQPQAKLSIQGNVGIGYTGVNQAIPVNGLAVFGNVGIGITTANSLLSVAGGAHIGGTYQGFSAPTDGLFVDGNVGIGATTSSNKLDIWGNARIAGTGVFDSTLTALNGLIGFSGVTAPASGLAISGNLGVGTTSPAGALHVVGQCVAKGTRIRRRRRRKQTSPSSDGDPKGLLGRWDEWIEEDIPVEDIKPDDEVLSLNDQTGEFEWHKVEKTWDKGIQAVLALTTSGNKRILTTKEHPYLVINSPQKTFGVIEVDQSIRVEELNKPTIIGFSYNNKTFTGKLSQTTKKELKRIYEKNHKPTLFAPETFANALVSLLKEAGVYPARLTIDLEYPGFAFAINTILSAGFPDTEIIYNSIGKHSPAHLAVYGATIGRRKIDAEVILVDKPTKKDRWHKAFRVVTHQDRNLTIRSPHGLLIPRFYSTPKDLSRAKWTKVSQIKIGRYVATADGWEKVVGIQGIGRIQTYDLQIEGTHNFVGNDIVAHNTYINGNLGIGTYSGLTLPTNGLAISGNVGIGTTTANSQLSISNNAHIGSLYQGISAPTDGLFVDGNVGIGTTTSSNKLDVWGNSRISGTLTVDSTGTLGSGLIGYSGVTAPTSGLAISGNLGVGTTSPTAPLHVWGNNTNSAFFLNGNVGIGTTSPNTALHLLSSSTQSPVFKIENTNADANPPYIILYKNTASAAANDIVGIFNFTSKDASGNDQTYASMRTTITNAENGSEAAQLRFDVANAGSTDTVMFLAGGNVGIGADTTPDNLFSVGSTSQFQVNSSGYALLPDGAASTPSLSFTGDTNTGMYRLGDDILRLTTAGSATAGITIAADGNIGIGTTTANSLLSVAGGAHIGSLRQGISAPTNGLFVDGNVGIGATTSSNKLDVWGNSRIAGTGIFDSTLTVGGVTTLQASNGALSFTGSTPSLTSGSSVFGLFAGGNVGIGTTGNLYGGLTVKGAGTGTNIALQTYGSGLGQGLTVLDNGNVGIGTTNPQFTLEINGTGKLNDSSWTYASDQRLKENIDSIKGPTALSIIEGLNPITYDYISGGQNRSGFIAQEVQTVLPGLVSTDPSTGMLGVRTDEILPYAVKAIQEQQNQLSAISLQLSDLQNTLSISADGTINIPALKAGTITLDPNIANIANTPGVGLDSPGVNTMVNLGTKIASLEERLAALESVIASNNLSLRTAGEAISTTEIATASTSAQPHNDENIAGEATASATLSTSEESPAVPPSEEASSSASIATTSAQTSSEAGSDSSEVSLHLTPPDILYATGSAQLANLTVHSEATFSGQLTAYDLDIQNGLKALGKTTLSDTLIAGDLNVDGTLAISGNSISTMDTLYVQNGPLAQSLDVLNGQFVFSPDGTLTVYGTVLASEFAVKQGTTAGTGTILAGQLDTIIENEYVDENSVILITPHTPLTQTLAVTDKVKGGFLIQLAHTESQNITFDYLIVGVR